MTLDKELPSLKRIQETLQFRLENPIEGEPEVDSVILLKIEGQSHLGDSFILIDGEEKTAQLFPTFDERNPHLTTTIALSAEILNDLVDGNKAFASVLMLGQVSISGELEGIRQFATLI